MSLATLRTSIEKAFLGVSTDEVMDRMRKLNRSVDDVSSRLDKGMAGIRKELRQLENQSADPRDGLYIIEDDCISCQVCVDVAPKTFRMREDGVAEVFDAYGSSLDELQESMDSCGGSCIALT